MGLIDSTNRVERALVSAKAERRTEREREQLERRYKADLKAELAGAQAQALEELRRKIENIYNEKGYEQAHLYFKSLDARNSVIKSVSNGEAVKRFAFDNYYKILAKVEKEQKQNWEYLQVQALEELREEKEKSIAKKNAVIASAKFILAVLRALAGAFILTLLAVAGFVDLSKSASTPKKRYR